MHRKITVNVVWSRNKQLICFNEDVRSPFKKGDIATVTNREIKAELDYITVYNYTLNDDSSYKFTSAEIFKYFKPYEKEE